CARGGGIYDYDHYAMDYW
nr:immunoglobulin heavy chain junction region [Mus musculus]